MVASWITLKAHKGLASGIAGRGLVAQQAIAAGEVVAVKGGHIRSTVEVAALPESLPNSAIQITDDLHLVAETLDEYEAVMLFLNHSCEPNVGFAGNVVVIAMREIAPGEELTTDYALFDGYEGAMPCSCGAAHFGRWSTAGTGSGRSCRRSTSVTSPGTWPAGLLAGGR